MRREGRLGSLWSLVNETRPVTESRTLGFLYLCPSPAVLYSVLSVVKVSHRPPPHGHTEAFRKLPGSSPVWYDLCPNYLHRDGSGGCPSECPSTTPPSQLKLCLLAVLLLDIGVGLTHPSPLVHVFNPDYTLIADEFSELD